MMSALHTRLFGLLALCWGCALIYFYHSQRIQDYLARDFHTLVLAGGIGIIVLGLYSLINPQEKKSSCDHEHKHDHDDHHHDHDHHHDDEGHRHDHDHGEEEHCGDCDHEHEGHGPVATYLLTLVPLIVAMTHTQDKLSNRGMAKKGLYEAPALNGLNAPTAFTREDLEKRVPKNEEGEFQLQLFAAYWAAGDREVQSIYEGLPVELEGRVAPEKIGNEAGNRMRIFRKIMSCCAADAQFVGVSMEFPDDAKRPAVDEWVKASGILTFETIDNKVLPLLKVRVVIPTEEPYSEFLLRQ